MKRKVELQKQFMWRELTDDGLLKIPEVGIKYEGDRRFDKTYNTIKEAIEDLNLCLNDDRYIFYSSHNRFVLVTLIRW